MTCLLILLMLCLLLRAGTTMDAASAACRLFVTAVLPGLFPYMVLSQMLVSRMKRLSPTLVMLLGWGGVKLLGLIFLSIFMNHAFGLLVEPGRKKRKMWAWIVRATS